jgi:hypothetical protein
MIKHIVFWKFHERAAGCSKDENLETARRMIEGMEGKIPGLKHIEAGINKKPGERGSDLALYSEFDSLEDLQIYQDHPEHQKVKEFLSEVRYEVRAVDYEI